MLMVPEPWPSRVTRVFGPTVTADLAQLEVERPSRRPRRTPPRVSAIAGAREHVAGEVVAMQVRALVAASTRRAVKRVVGGVDGAEGDGHGVVGERGQLREAGGAGEHRSR